MSGVRTISSCSVSASLNLRPIVSLYFSDSLALGFFDPLVFTRGASRVNFLFETWVDFIVTECNVLKYYKAYEIPLVF